jgi:hypothetical protein
MEESAAGALVPSVKAEPSLDPAAEPLPPDPPEPAPEDAGPSDMDKDSLCPICMQIISDAFLTACGHSFCYICIVTHLRNKSDCPCCGHYLTTAHIFPNFLLDKVFFFPFKRFFEIFVCGSVSRCSVCYLRNVGENEMMHVQLSSSSLTI